ncbi:MAG: Dam family site-specific DNA-(adenine-N6)-methyltransferase [Alphaproteobacteria bacterium]|nr:Dam family site-specific DNA-(adenine-N6)-methyltransferase [Alphaproteobacteria bacterium]
MLRSDVTPIVPFLKWAGGKRWFAEHAREITPPNFDRYVEPFLGGGALYFHLRPQRALLADLNARLIETYVTLQSDWKKVRTILAWHQSRHSDQHYYAERSRERRTPHARAAQFIYLNRTCWNGLYRVNLAGQFNVPKGTKSSVLLDTDDFEETSRQLQGCILRCSDFGLILGECGKGDFVFVDPPYTVKHNVNGFVKYNETLFSWDDQVRLRDDVVEAATRGAKVLITNADHPSVRALYRGVGTMRSVNRSSVLAADSSYRSKVSELVVSTW